MDLFLARSKSKITQWEVARRTGISQSQISLYERGFRTPSAKAKKKIADALGLPMEAIEWPETY